MPAREAFTPESEPLVLREADGFALLSRHPTASDSSLITGWEPMWGFACPLVGPQVTAVASAVVDALARRSDWQHLVLPGFPRDLVLVRAVAPVLSALGEVRAGEGLVRHRADLSDRAGWWLRRSGRFRRNLRRNRSRAEAEGLEFEDARDDPALVDRLQQIERRSWKGAEQDGLCHPEMFDFYRRLVAELQPGGRIRCLIAVLRGRDVGFVLGGIRGEIYRGFQLSYASEVSEFSIGHQLQWQQIQELEPEIRVYDLGMQMAYKRSWADTELRSVTLVVHRRPPSAVQFERSVDARGHDH